MGRFPYALVEAHLGRSQPVDHPDDWNSVDAGSDGGAGGKTAKKKPRIEFTEMWHEGTKIGMKAAATPPAWLVKSPPKEKLMVHIPCHQSKTWRKMSWLIPVGPDRAALEWAGAPVAPASTRGHAAPMKKDLFIFRVMDVKRYLTDRYGPGKLIYDARKDPERFVHPFAGTTQGIIAFEWRGDPREFGALGHADLFRVILSNDKPPTLIPGCAGHCYWMDTKAPMVAHLWEMSP